MLPQYEVYKALKAVWPLCELSVKALSMGRDGLNGFRASWGCARVCYIIRHLCPLQAGVAQSVLVLLVGAVQNIVILGSTLFNGSFFFLFAHPQSGHRVHKSLNLPAAFVSLPHESLLQTTWDLFMYVYYIMFLQSLKALRTSKSSRKNS